MDVYNSYPAMIAVVIFFMGTCIFSFLNGYKAFDGYWGTKPKIDTLVFSITPDASV